FRSGENVVVADRPPGFRWSVGCALRRIVYGATRYSEASSLERSHTHSSPRTGDHSRRRPPRARESNDTSRMLRVALTSHGRFYSIKILSYVRGSRQERHSL